MGDIAVHEFVSLDGVFEDPSRTFDFGFVPEMGDSLGAITGASKAILLGQQRVAAAGPKLSVGADHQYASVRSSGKTPLKWRHSRPR